MEAEQQKACCSPDTLNHGNADHIKQQLAGDQMLKRHFASFKQERCSEAILVFFFFFLSDQCHCSQTANHRSEQATRLRNPVSTVYHTFQKAETRLESAGLVLMCSRYERMNN